MCTHRMYREADAQKHTHGHTQPRGAASFTSPVSTGDTELAEPVSHHQTAVPFTVQQFSKDFSHTVFHLRWGKHCYPHLENVDTHRD